MGMTGNDNENKTIKTMANSKWQMANGTNVIAFRHRYYKLEQAEFTTIRGKGWMKKLAVGDMVQVDVPGGFWCATVTGLELRRVRDMPVEFLKADAEYPGCTLGTQQQFVNLLNSLRAPYWAQVTLDSEMTIITLRKVAG